MYFFTGRWAYNGGGAGGGAYKGRFTASNKLEQKIAGYRIRIECENLTKKRYRKTLHGYVSPLKLQTYG